MNTLSTILIMLGQCFIMYAFYLNMKRIELTNYRLGVLGKVVAAVMLHLGLDKEPPKLLPSPAAFFKADQKEEVREV